MSFHFTACPGPIANVMYLHSGAVSAQYTTIADESLWLTDFTRWTRGAGAATILDSLDPEGALGVTWSEVIESYADKHGATPTDDDRDHLSATLDDDGTLSDLEGTDLRDLAVNAMADLVIHHARAAFDTDMDETHVHAGEVVTGGPVMLDEDDVDHYPTRVFQSVEFLRPLPYFKYRAPFTVIHNVTPQSRESRDEP